MRLSTALAGLAASALSSAAFAAENWSQFRGPNGAGISETGTPPVSFGPDQNLHWKSPAPAGVSSPVVWGDRIFLTGVDDKQLLTLAYDAVSGRELWRQDAAAEKLESTHPFSSPAASTPCTEGRLVFAYFNSFGVLAYDFNGAEVWRRPLPTLRTQYGSASSPVIIGGKLIIQRDGGTTDSHLLALDPATGKTVWDSPRALARDGHSTPMLWRHDGKDELMVQGRGSLMAYDVATGESKWWVQGWGMADGGRLSVFRPATGERVLDRQPCGVGGQYVASPIAANGLIYVVNETGTVGVLRAGDKIDLVAKNALGENVRSTPAIAGGTLIIRTSGHLWAFGG